MSARERRLVLQVDKLRAFRSSFTMESIFLWRISHSTYLFAIRFWSMCHLHNGKRWFMRCDEYQKGCSARHQLMNFLLNPISLLLASTGYLDG